jgi:hypothetical protein
MTTSRKPLISALFGQYADSRLIHASLDPINADEIKSRCDFITRLPQGPDGAVWVDYVVDLGDGFDSTYAIAYLLGQKSLDIEGAGMLPRAGAHYGRRPGLSEATRDNYKKRMLNPYKFAFPDSEAPTRTPHTLVKFPGELMLRACQRPLWAKADIDRGFDVGRSMPVCEAWSKPRNIGG